MRTLFFVKALPGIPIQSRFLADLFHETPKCNLIAKSFALKTHTVNLRDGSSAGIDALKIGFASKNCLGKIGAFAKTGIDKPGVFDELRFIKQHVSVKHYGAKQCPSAENCFPKRTDPLECTAVKTGGFFERRTDEPRLS